MCNAKLYTYYRELYIIFTNGFEIPKLQNSFHPVMFLMGHISKFDVFNAGRVLAGCLILLIVKPPQNPTPSV